MPRAPSPKDNQASTTTPKKAAAPKKATRAAPPRARAITALTFNEMLTRIVNERLGQARYSLRYEGQSKWSLMSEMGNGDVMQEANSGSTTLLYIRLTSSSTFDVEMLLPFELILNNLPLTNTNNHMVELSTVLISVLNWPNVVVATERRVRFLQQMQQMQPMPHMIVRAQP